MFDLQNLDTIDTDVKILISAFIIISLIFFCCFASHVMIRESMKQNPKKIN